MTGAEQPSTTHMHPPLQRPHSKRRPLETPQVLTLTDSQIELLQAMNAPVQAHISRGMVWIRRRPYKVPDLFALRAAGLVQAAEFGNGARGVHRFELTARGITEARRRCFGRVPPAIRGRPPTATARVRRPEYDREPD